MIIPIVASASRVSDVFSPLHFIKDYSAALLAHGCEYILHQVITGLSLLFCLDKNLFKDSCQPISQSPVPLRAAELPLCIRPLTVPSLSDRGTLHSPPHMPRLRPICLFCSAAVVLRVCSVSLLPAPILPASLAPTLRLSCAVIDMDAQGERGPVCQSTAVGKWRLGWRRHALYIKWPDPCDGSGGWSSWGYTDSILQTRSKGWSKDLLRATFEMMNKTFSV